MHFTPPRPSLAPLLFPPPRCAGRLVATSLLPLARPSSSRRSWFSAAINSVQHVGCTPGLPIQHNPRHLAPLVTPARVIHHRHSSANLPHFSIAGNSPSRHQRPFRGADRFPALSQPDPLPPHKRRRRNIKVPFKGDGAECCALPAAEEQSKIFSTPERLADMQRLRIDEEERPRFSDR